MNYRKSCKVQAGPRASVRDSRKAACSGKKVPFPVLARLTPLKRHFKQVHIPLLSCFENGFRDGAILGLFLRICTLLIRNRLCYFFLGYRQILTLQILLSLTMTFYRVEVSTRSSWGDRKINKHSVMKQEEL